MRFVTVRKWLYILSTGGLLLQAAPGGCPDTTQLLGVVAGSTQSLITGVVDLYVEAAVTSFFGL